MTRFKVLRDPASSLGSFGPGRAAFDAGISAESGRVELTFTVPEARGESVYQVIAVPDNFKVLAKAMMQANYEAAIKAFGAALEAGIPEKEEVWRP